MKSPAQLWISTIIHFWGFFPWCQLPRTSEVLNPTRRFNDSDESKVTPKGWIFFFHRGNGDLNDAKKKTPGFCKQILTVHWYGLCQGNPLLASLNPFHNLIRYRNPLLILLSKLPSLNSMLPIFAEIAMAGSCGCRTPRSKPPHRFNPMDSCGSKTRLTQS